MVLIGLRDRNVSAKHVLVRVDFNVPLDEHCAITDATRIERTLPTLRYLQEQGAKMALMAHLGKPKGKDPKMSLKPAADYLASKGFPVRMLPDCIGPEVSDAVRDQGDEILMLENLRFHEGENANDPEFAKALAAPFDLYVDDAFGEAHREVASVSAVTKFLPGAMGFLLEGEIKRLSEALHPERPFVVLIGGAKISTKLGLIRHLLKDADAVLLGGAMIFTFYKAKGLEIGKSLYEDHMVDEAKALLGEKNLFLPTDIVIAAEKSDAAAASVVPPESIPADQYGLDIGPESVKHFSAQLSAAKTVVWNGPMGMFELAPFAKGTLGIAETLAHADAKVIVGGGDSVSAIDHLGLADRFYHISTGGGASLTFLEGKELPALAALEANAARFPRE